MASKKGDLKPPPPLRLTGDLSANWRKWEQSFRVYMKATGTENKPKDVKMRIMLQLLGEDALEVYKSVEIDYDDPSKKTVEEVLEAFQNYCVPKLKNVVLERHRFWSHAMSPTIPIDLFVAELRQLSKNCDFGFFSKDMIRDKIVLSVDDKGLKKRLLSDPELTLENAIDMCRAEKGPSTPKKTLVRSNGGVHIVTVGTPSSKNPKPIGQKVAADICVLGAKPHLLMMNYHTKNCVVVPLENSGANAVVSTMKEMFARIGTPRELLCRHDVFTALKIMKYAVSEGIHLSALTPGDGPVRDALESIRDTLNKELPPTGSQAVEKQEDIKGQQKDRGDCGDVAFLSKQQPGNSVDEVELPDQSKAGPSSTRWGLVDFVAEHFPDRKSAKEWGSPQGRNSSTHSSKGPNMVKDVLNSNAKRSLSEQISRKEKQPKKVKRQKVEPQQPETLSPVKHTTTGRTVKMPSRFLDYYSGSVPIPDNSLTPKQSEEASP